MVPEEEDRYGDWMKIAHTAIITKMVQFLAEWEDIRAYTASKNREIKLTDAMFLAKTPWQTAEKSNLRETKKGCSP